MKTTTPTFRWIAATLTAVMLLGPLVPSLAHACAGMEMPGEMSGHSSMSHTSTAHTSTAHTSMADMSSADMPPDMATHEARALASAEAASGSSHNCNGLCTGSDCCSMQATPVSQGDGFLAERVQSVTLVVPVGPERFTALFARADRAPPRPPQPDISPSLLSARLHVWMATFLT